MTSRGAAAAAAAPKCGGGSVEARAEPPSLTVVADGGVGAVDGVLAFSVVGAACAAPPPGDMGSTSSIVFGLGTRKALISKLPALTRRKLVG